MRSWKPPPGRLRLDCRLRPRVAQPSHAAALAGSASPDSHPIGTPAHRQSHIFPLSAPGLASMLLSRSRWHPVAGGHAPRCYSRIYDRAIHCAMRQRLAEDLRPRPQQIAETRGQPRREPWPARPNGPHPVAPPRPAWRRGSGFVAYPLSGYDRRRPPAAVNNARTVRIGFAGPINSDGAVASYSAVLPEPVPAHEPRLPLLPPSRLSPHRSAATWPLSAPPWIKLCSAPPPRSCDVSSPRCL